MKDYPSIDKQVRNGTYYVFAKDDGSQIRVEWVRKKGFVKFGRRNGLLDDSNPFLPEARGLFMEKYAEGLGRALHDARYEMATAFLEFWGPGSFAGNHIVEPHTVTLFDIAPYKKGILEPCEFLKLCGDTVDHATLLHHGLVNQEFADLVRTSQLEGMPLEGVVCKGPWDRKAGMPLMFKIKSEAWLLKLRGYCGDDDALFARLA